MGNQTQPFLDLPAQTNRTHQRQPSTPNQQRIAGFDVARSLAIFLMVVVNFKIAVMFDQEAQGWLAAVGKVLEGKGAALFVILAGVGMSLMAKRTQIQESPTALWALRKTILRRAAFLFVFGLLWVSLWPADILHFYGLYLILGAVLLFAPTRYLLLVGLFCVVVFVVLLFTLDYERGWLWTTLEYTDLWTLRGMVRHLFFNGFHPVFPWAVFICLGLWLGRQDWLRRSFRRRAAIFGVALLALAELASAVAQALIVPDLPPAVVQDLLPVLMTGPMPPMPQYIMAGMGSSLLLLSLCVGGHLHLQRLGLQRWLRPLVHAGQQSLTIYVAHVVLGLGLLEEFGKLNSQQFELAMVSALVFYICAVVAATSWARYLGRGPFERLLRWLSQDPGTTGGNHPSPQTKVSSS